MAKRTKKNKLKGTPKRPRKSKSKTPKTKRSNNANSKTPKRSDDMKPKSEIPAVHSKQRRSNRSKRKSLRQTESENYLESGMVWYGNKQVRPSEQGVSASRWLDYSAGTDHAPDESLLVR